MFLTTGTMNQRLLSIAAVSARHLISRASVSCHFLAGVLLLGTTAPVLANNTVSISSHGSGHDVTVSQTGDLNTVSVTAGDDLGDSQNVVDIEQGGDRNLLVLDQIDDGATAQFVQSGSSSIATIAQGESDSLEADQSGLGNVLLIDQNQGVPERGHNTANISQSGSTNTVDIIQDQLNAATIVQTGDGNTALVEQRARATEQSNLTSQVTIEQHGNGALADVSHFVSAAHDVYVAIVQTGDDGEAYFDGTASNTVGQIVQNGNANGASLRQFAPDSEGGISQDADNNALIEQHGAGLHAATIRQSDFFGGSGFESTANEAEVYQHDLFQEAQVIQDQGNFASVDQAGRFNWILVDQSSSVSSVSQNNFVQIGQFGDFGQIRVEQNDGNSANISQGAVALSSNEGNSINVRQFGDAVGDQDAVQVGQFGVGGNAIDITQYDDDVNSSVLVEQSGAFNSMTIIQGSEGGPPVDFDPGEVCDCS